MTFKWKEKHVQNNSLQSGGHFVWVVCQTLHSTHWCMSLTCVSVSLYACVCVWFVGVCDDCGVWVGVLHQDLGGWLLLQIPRMAGKAEICQEALLCHR